jgi:predicted membrane channel-forming protein YqfA (hemolysin III family)
MRSTIKWLLWLLVVVWLIGFVREKGISLDFDFNGLRLLIYISEIVWLATLINLLSRRNIDIHDKLSWVVALLLLNIIGAILYMFFAPAPPQASASQSGDTDKPDMRGPVL